MKVFVKGKGEVTLTQANFVAQGGQASVYQRNGTAYKVYTEEKNAIAEAKFRELAKIDDPNVVRPETLLLKSSAAAEPIGYTMRFVQDTYALCQLFPRAFRERTGMTADATHKLVGKLQERVARVHRAGAVIVDLNELNVLAAQALDDVFLIDVDSYQVAGYPAEVIMSSVRDWTVRHGQFTALSDWFSFAVLAFQLYVGAHPYRGTHASTAQLPPDKRLEARMRANLSALGPGVSLPKACYPIDAIPAVQRAWLYAVLQEGKRLEPPTPGALLPAVRMAPAAAQTAAFGGQLTVTEVGEFDAEVLACAVSGSRELILTASGIYLNRRLLYPWKPEGTVLLGFTPKLDEPVALVLNRGELTLIHVSARHAEKLELFAREIALADGRFYVRGREQVYEVEFIESASRIMAAANHVVANVIEHAARLYEGCAIQSMLGSVFVSLFTRPRAGYQVRVPELDAYRVIDAKFERGVLMVLGAKGGRYDRLVFRFSSDFVQYDLRTIEGVQSAGLNFLVTPTNVCVCLTEDEKLEAFPAVMGNPTARVVEDEAVGGDMRLMSIGGTVGFARGAKLFTMRLK